MEISVSKYAGFCDGVERAFDMVKDIADDPQTKKPIFVLGALVHNQDVVDEIEKRGIETVNIKGKDLKEVIRNLKNKAKTVVLTAHGMGPMVYEFFEKEEIDLIDTTCPRVAKAQRLAQVFWKRGYKIVIIGESNHKEVKGINEWTDNNAIFIEKESDFDKLNLNKDEKIFVLSQTTQNQDFVGKMAFKIKNKYKNAEFIDTLCLATHNRQTEVKELAKNNEIMIVIGSPTSANSNRLYEVARENNPDSFFVENVNEIKKEWFSGKDSVGISAGASTPPWIIEEIIKKVKTF